MCIFEYYSHEYKTRRILDLDKILLYVDVNLHHDQVTVRAVTACLHIVNVTPSHWHTKRQSTVETGTFCSEFVAARIATDQIIDLSYTLMYLGVPVRSKSYMLVITNL